MLGMMLRVAGVTGDLPMTVLRLLCSITTIAQTLAQLPALKYVDLGYDQLEGPLDTACGLAATKKLQQLNLMNNCAHGEHPGMHHAAAPDGGDASGLQHADGEHPGVPEQQQPPRLLHGCLPGVKCVHPSAFLHVNLCPWAASAFMLEIGSA